MRNLLILVGILGMSAAPLAMGQTRALTPDQAMKASGGPGFPVMAAKTRALAEAADAGGLAVHMAAMKADPTLDTATRERLLYEGVQAAAPLVPDTALREQVAALRDYRSQTLIWTDDHGHREFRPLFDLAVAARHTQRVWAEREARTAAMKAIVTGDAELISWFAAATATQRAGAVAAVREARPAQLLAYQPALLEALDQGQPVGELAAAVAVGTRDAALMSMVLSSAPPGVALRALSEIESPGWSGESAVLLMVAAQRAEIASAALLAMGRLSVTDARAEEHLFQALGGPSGASAAAALARNGSAETVAGLGRILGADGDESRRRHALLGLRLATSPAARQELAAFAADPRSPIDLVAEVPAWRRD